MLKRLLFFLILPFLTCCQKHGNIDKVAGLARSLSEVSGIATFTGDPLVYVIADHGNPNVVFALDPQNGGIKKEIRVGNATNGDWEDLATDKDGRFFIGDFGNNESDRDDQVIYTIDALPASLKPIDTLLAKKTTFTLADQQDFPAKVKDWNFDIEAFIYKDDYFYLFTRNRKRKNFDGVTKVYKIPAQEGNYEAKPIASFTICDDDKDCFITSATIAQDGKTLLLLTYNKVIRLTGFTGDDFFGGKIEKLKFDHRSQKEGIAYKNDSTVYIVDERRAQTGGNLYTFDLTKK